MIQADKYNQQEITMKLDRVDLTSGADSETVDYLLSTLLSAS